MDVFLGWSVYLRPVVMDASLPSNRGGPLLDVLVEKNVHLRPVAQGGAVTTR